MLNQIECNVFTIPSLMRIGCREALELGVINKKRPHSATFKLPDLDSNQDKLNQNKLYYPYTIGQILRSFERVQMYTCNSHLQTLNLDCPAITFAS